MLNNYTLGLIVIIVLLIILIILYLMLLASITTGPTVTVPFKREPTILADPHFYPHIPKQIFLSWWTRDLPQDMYENAYLSWVKHNPDYTIYWLDDQDCEDFMKKTCNDLEYRV